MYRPHFCCLLGSRCNSAGRCSKVRHDIHCWSTVQRWFRLSHHRSFHFILCHHSQHKGIQLQLELRPGEHNGAAGQSESADRKRQFHGLHCRTQQRSVYHRLRHVCIILGISDWWLHGISTDFVFSPKSCLFLSPFSSSLRRRLSHKIWLTLQFFDWRFDASHIIDRLQRENFLFYSTAFIDLRCSRPPLRCLRKMKTWETSQCPKSRYCRIFKNENIIKRILSFC